MSEMFPNVPIIQAGAVCRLSLLIDDMNCAKLRPVAIRVLAARKANDYLTADYLVKWRQNYSQLVADLKPKSYSRGFRG
jgi:hypothetical protein